MAKNESLFAILKKPSHTFSEEKIKALFAETSEVRVNTLAENLKSDLARNLPAIYRRRSALSDYRTNPYVMLATASIMELSEADEFASFLFNSKLSMGLETSFGKIVERAFIVNLPNNTNEKWSDPDEKISEQEAISKLKGREAKSAARNNSKWREIDKSLYLNNRRYITSLKSGPNTINDTQVQGMADAIANNHTTWLEQSKNVDPYLEGIDVVIGLTYGTEKTTNNKDNQILSKLTEYGFSELDPNLEPGVLIDDATNSVRVYRRVGKSFWSWAANPSNESEFPAAFLEILLGLVTALKLLKAETTLEDEINDRVETLAAAMLRMRFPKGALPNWVKDDLSADDLFWLATAISAFYDDGI